jgi:hypothetical protein
LCGLTRLAFSGKGCNARLPGGLPLHKEVSMDIVTKYLSTLVNRMQDGKEAKKELIRLTRKSPEEVLHFFEKLPSSEQRYLHWLPAIAKQNSEQEAF